MTPTASTIQRKLMRMLLVTSGVVLLLTSGAFLLYEYITFRQNSVREITTVAQIIATNSTAVLAFENQADAREVLSALRAERQIVAAGLYDRNGRLFAQYPETPPPPGLPSRPEPDGVRFADASLIAFTPVIQAQGSRRLGTLYLRSNLEAMYQRLRLYSGVSVLVITVALLVAYLLSRQLQRQISDPILSLAHTAGIISARHDYTVRAAPTGDGELALLNVAFNQMLGQIEQQDRALRESEARIRHRVSERTAELEAANKDLESFCYSVSHDLRTPLRAVAGFAELLRKSPSAPLPPEAARYLDLIHQGTEQMNQLITDLLAFSQQGKKELTLQPVEVMTLVQEVFADLEIERQDREVEFRVQPLPPATADPGLLRQVWVNLISNALKFTRPRERAVIEVGTLPPRAGQAPVYFIRDNGVGFDMRDEARLFGVFQRLHAVGEFEGSGIGLTTVLRIIERHRGRVWAEGIPGEGATFFFTLPVP